MVRPLTDDLENRWFPGAEFSSDAERPASYTVAEVAPYRGDLLVRFAEVRDRTGAEALRGTSFTIDAAERRDLEEGEYWVEDLVGCAVVDQDGDPIGVVESVEFGAAQDRRLPRVRPFGRLIYLMPPYIISASELDQLCAAVSQAAAIYAQMKPEIEEKAKTFGQ